MISCTFMKQLLFSAKLAAVRLRRVAEFILVRGIMRATLVTRVGEDEFRSVELFVVTSDRGLCGALNRSSG